MTTTTTTATSEHVPTTLDTESAAESATEATNATIARKVARDYADQLCYVRASDRTHDRAAGWLTFRTGAGADTGGGVWTRDGAEKAALEAVDRTIRAMLQDAAKDPDSSRMRERSRDLLNALNRLPAIKQVAAFYLDQPLSKFNADPYLLNVRNGVLNLRALAPDADDGPLFRPAQGSDFCSKQANAAYDATATAPRWERFLDEVFESDAEVIGFVQRALGYTLLGLNPEHAAFICHGSGGNGKTVALDTVSDVLGSYAGDLSPDVLVSDLVRSGSALQPEMTCHRDVRLIVSSEPKRGVLNGHRLKSWTGDSHIQLRMLYGEAESMPVTFTFWMTTNVLPDLSEQTVAVERRLHIIPFRVSFHGRENLDLKAELASERDGILNWLLEGLRDWHRRRAESARGNSGLCPPEVIVQASQDWLTSESLFTRLFDEVLVRGNSKDRLLLCDLTDALADYVDEHDDDFPHTVVNARLVNNFLKTFGLVKRTVGGQVYVYSVKLDQEMPDDDQGYEVHTTDPFSTRERIYLAVCEYGGRLVRVGTVAAATGLPQRSLYVTLARMADDGLLAKRGPSYCPGIESLVIEPEPLSETYDVDLGRAQFLDHLFWKCLYEQARERGSGVITVNVRALAGRLGIHEVDLEHLMRAETNAGYGLSEATHFDANRGDVSTFTFDLAQAPHVRDATDSVLD